MTNSQAKSCLLSGQPVIYHGHRDNITFKCIRGIIYRRVKEKIIVFVELLDKSENSIMTVPVSTVEPIGDTNGIYDKIADVAL